MHKNTVLYILSHILLLIIPIINSTCCKRNTCNCQRSSQGYNSNNYGNAVVPQNVYPVQAISYPTNDRIAGYNDEAFRDFNSYQRGRIRQLRRYRANLKRTNKLQDRIYDAEGNLRGLTEPPFPRAVAGGNAAFPSPPAQNIPSTGDSYSSGGYQLASAQLSSQDPYSSSSYVDQMPGVGGMSQVNPVISSGYPASQPGDWEWEGDPVQFHQSISINPDYGNGYSQRTIQRSQSKSLKVPDLPKIAERVKSVKASDPPQSAPPIHKPKFNRIVADPASNIDLVGVNPFAETKLSKIAKDLGKNLENNPVINNLAVKASGAFQPDQN